MKNSPANAIKISVAIQTLFDRRDSEKPEKINISLISGCCLWTSRDHNKTIGDKNWDEFKSFFKINRGVWGLRFRRLSFGVWSFGSEVWVYGVWVFVTPDGLACSFERLSVEKSLWSPWFTYLDVAIDWGSLTSLFTVGLFTCGDSWLDVDNSSNVLEVSGTSNRPISLISLIVSRRSDVKFPFFTNN